MSQQVLVPNTEVYQLHWWAYRMPIAAAGGLALLGTVIGLVLQPVGLILWVPALALGAAAYLHWTWHTLAFTQDNRLIWRHGFLGTNEDLINLFGTIRKRQTPVLGRWLDVGNIYLGVPGPDAQVCHIARFDAFFRRILYSQEQINRQPHVHLHYVRLVGQPMRPTSGNIHSQTYLD